MIPWVWDGLERDWRCLSVNSVQNYGICRLEAGAWSGLRL